MRDKKVFGLAGEDMTVKMLYSSGYDIVERNYRCRMGEVDIICEKDGSLVFIEVKSRGDMSYGRPSEAVTYAKKQKIKRTASYYMLTHGIKDSKIRFDVVEIGYSHIKNAF